MSLYDELIDRLDALRDADSREARWDVEEDLRNLALRLRGAIVLTPTAADAQRLAEATVPELYRHSAGFIQERLTENARAVLDRLAAGTDTDDPERA